MLFISQYHRIPGRIRWRLLRGVVVLVVAAVALTSGVNAIAQADTAADAAPPPVQLPDHWRTDRVEESVFGGEVFVARSGSHTHPTVVLIHGLGQVGLEDWLPVVPALESRFHVIALDLPGFGRSAAPLGQYSPSNYAAVVRQVTQRYAKGPLHIVGHSMGGAVALRYAQLYPDDIVSMALVDAAGILTRTSFVKHSTEALVEGQPVPGVLEGVRSIAGRYIGNLLESLGGLPDPSARLGNYQILWGGLLANQTNLNAALALVNEDFSDAVFGNTHRTSIIWGREDAVSPLRTGKLLAGQLGNASLHIIEGAGHVPMTSHTGVFNQLLLSVLTNTPYIAPGSQGQSLQCDGQDAQAFSGSYTHVSIRNCHGVTLRNVAARQLVIVDSSVDLEDVAIDADALALQIERSTVTATNLRVSGAKGIRVADARLDFAGADITASAMGIEVVAPSRLIFSISRMHSPLYQGNFHGQFYVDTGALESSLP